MSAAGSTRRLVLVTGGSDGIGLATAQAFAAAGHGVAIAGRDQARLLSALAVLPEGALSVAMDVADSGSIARAVSRLSSDGFQVDVLVNNAGLMGNAKPLGSELDKELRRSMDANVFGPALLCSLLVPDMRKRGWGRIVNVASSAGLFAPLRQLPYSTSKAALIALTRGMAVELAGSGVTANAVAPGPVATSAYVRAKGEAGATARARSIPSGRLARPDEIAAAIVFLAGDMAGHITGHTLSLDGGEAAAGPYTTMFPPGS
ncbi:SDR family NAD(P)-dependent oxidoreductase [Chelatococcus asaccharovorans]|uniref:Gluconate 5-dehydrogenase n=1 Tax=Chelatococcus asaccharovorans TaxID=28210 RepID=A0A2V3U371_9HYPH|nr:SDR family oxidoreductase [Chelatococcus asaccharovorans]MBS7702884.1 SDR family oxidoreductase [Chelatococcus asaccharovorans]PXW57184.1 gluconate 5-dehydrogenase [Chelatococcus asaccharovorans]